MKKWLFFWSFLFTLMAPAKEVHPYHVGSVEINYNTKTKTFEITARLYMDDLENALNKKYGKALHFGDEKSKAALNEVLKDYFAENLKLKSNNKNLKVNYLGFEEDKEAVNIYLESETAQKPLKVETAVSLLYNLFEDQMNIIHIIVNGERKSSKLTYPDRYLYQVFTS